MNTPTYPYIKPEPRNFERFNAGDVVAASSDFFRHALGSAGTSKHLHVLARELTLSEVCYAHGVLADVQSADRSPAALIDAGLQTPALQRILQSEAERFILVGYDHGAEFTEWAPELPVRDFRARQIDTFQISEGLDPLGELSEVKRAKAFNFHASGAAVQLQSFGKIFAIDGNRILADDVTAIKLLFQGVATLPAATEVGLLTTLIEGNPTLSDGAAVFDVSNTLALALDEDNLGTAVGMLRRQGPTGIPLNLAARHLVVHPDLEVKANRLIRESGMDAIHVTALPGLAAGRWLVLCDPAVLAPIVRPKLENAPIARVDIRQGFERAGVALRVVVETGAAFVGRVGMVRGGA